MITFENPLTFILAPSSGQSFEFDQNLTSCSAAPFVECKMANVKSPA